MDINLILTIAGIISGALTTGIPALIKIIKDVKALKKAKGQQAASEALADMKAHMKTFIQAAEIAYEDVNAALKAKGSSAGPMKEDSVLIKLQSYAAEKGYEYDADYWHNEIVEEVNYTRTVNAK